MSLVKIPFLFTGLLSGYGMLTPPQPRVPTRDRHREVKPFERWFSATVRIHAIILKVLVLQPLHATSIDIERRRHWLAVHL